jgi:hypothetical protein
MALGLATENSTVGPHPLGHDATQKSAKSQRPKHKDSVSLEVGAEKSTAPSFVVQLCILSQ